MRSLSILIQSLIQLKLQFHPFTLFTYYNNNLMNWAFLFLIPFVLSQFEVNIDHEDIVTIGSGTKTTLVMTSNLTTGYRWKITNPPSEIQITEKEFRAPKTNMLGVAGQQVWEIECVEPCIEDTVHTLVFEKSRPWEDFSVYSKNVLVKVGNEDF